MVSSGQTLHRTPSPTAARRLHQAYTASDGGLDSQEQDPILQASGLVHTLPAARDGRGKASDTAS